MNFDYTKETKKDFEDAVRSVKEEVASAGLKVLVVHDFQKSISGAGFEMEPFNMIEFCSPKFANSFLNADIKIGLCMPCKINVYMKAGVIYVSAMRPIILKEFFPKANLSESSEEIDGIIRSIVDKSI
jgi:uncharacterized protein (DUF302 family)